jgi:hypothetical protein
MGVGFLVTIAAIPGVILLLITVVGIPLAGLVLFMLLIYGYLAKVVVGYALGRWMSAKFNWKMTPYTEFALGLLIIYIIKLIPVVGFLAGLIVFWIGLGALTLKVFSKVN